MQRHALAPAALLLAAVVAVCVNGCTHVATTRERRTSFAPHASVRVGQEPIRSFLLSRTAILMSGGEVVALRNAEGQITGLNVQGSSPGELGYGSATAIDRRGYLLTAAHCLGKGPVYVLFGGNGGIGRFEKAVVVWRGDMQKKEPDLAVLRISQPLDSTFTWASNFEPKDAVLAAGLDYDQPLNFEMGCLAGKITKVDRRKESSIGHELVFHEAPLHGGDSGGPLIARDGTLIGINTAAGSLRIWPFLLKVSIAERLNIAWLRALIDEDFARAADVASAQPEQSSDGSRH